MNETIRTCWAISAALKSRCDMPAGHTGNHSITVEWGEEQCWMPEIDEPIALEVVPSPVPIEVAKCEACSHMHKNAECKCGCYTHI
jgi:hypothetical protein